MKTKEKTCRNFTTNHFQLFEQVPGAWGCKDKSSVIIYANDDYCKLAGLAHPNEMIGKTDFDMPFETVNCAKLFRAQDKKVMTAGKPIRVLDIHPFPDLLWKAYLVTKAPLKNNQGQIIGTIFHAENLTDIHYEIGTLLATFSAKQKSNHNLHNYNSFFNDSLSTIKLTKRQSEVLFFYLRGKTVKQIADILEIAYRTTDEYLNQLRMKFNAVSRYALIEKAIHHGFLNTIPESLFNVQVSIELPS